MTQSYWAIRFYLPFEEDKTIQFLGNFEHAGKRYLDDILVFSGIYGTPDYMMWYVHKDLLAYNYSAYSIDLKLFLNGDPESCYFNENYRIVDVTDDSKSDRKVVYAIHEDYAKLDTLLIDAEVTTLEYKETRNVEDLLKEVLEEGGIFPVIFCEHEEQELQSIKFEYPKFTLNPDWTVRDFIQYIAQENKFEWTIKHGILFIGPELYAYKNMKASKDYLNRTVDNISKNYWNVKIFWAASPLDVLYYYELIDDEKLTDMRCIWAKHWVGANGDTTKGCFVQIGRSVDKIAYIQSLEGIKEQINAFHYLFRVPKMHQLRLVKTIEDSGDNEFVDEITLQKNVDEYTKKTPRNVVMETDEPLYTLPKVGRTTPYLDYGAGLFFPRPYDITKAPNQVLLEIDDRVEEAVLGPFVMGDGTEDFRENIPFKNPDDFRFSLPNGWTVYITSDGYTVLQPSATEVTEEPLEDTDQMQIILDPATGRMVINKDGNTWLELTDDGKVSINAENNVDINCGSGSEVKINSGGVAVSLTGHTHPFTGHVHQVPQGPAIPGPPATAVTASASIQGETDKHSKHLKAVKG